MRRRHLLLIAFFCIVTTLSGEPKTSRIFIGKNIFIVEIAKTPEERKTGLMFRNTLDPHHGMLFVFEKSDIHGFWMHNTFIPLDMLWIDAQNKIVYLHENAKPMDDTPIIPKKTAKYVLELPAGSIQKYKLKENMRIRLK